MSSEVPPEESLDEKVEPHSRICSPKEDLGNKPSNNQIVLRRAVYVTIEELIHSQYEVDMNRLKSELTKLRTPGGTSAPELLDHHNGTSKSVPVAETPHNSHSSQESREQKQTCGDVPPELKVRPSLLSVPPDTCSVGFSHVNQAKHPHQSRLQPPRDGFNLCLLVGKVELVVDKLRVDGSRVLVAEVEVGDETGSLSVRARDEQIDLLREVSQESGAIVLRNCTMELYQGRHLRLAVTKWGKLNVYPDGIASTPDPPKSMNKELNFSVVDLNNVALSKVLVGPPLSPIVGSQKGQKQQHSIKYTVVNIDESPARGPRQRQRKYHHQKKKRDEWLHHQQNPCGQHMNPPHPQYLLHERGSGASIGLMPSMHFPHYVGGSAIDAQYPFQSQQQDQGPQHHRYHLPNDPYKRQQQLLYQQYELQQRHAHQMHMLQQQQETQRRILEQQQMSQAPMSSLIPDLRRAESHDSVGEFPPSTIGPVPSPLQLGPFTVSTSNAPPQQHMSSPQTRMAMGGADYQYSPVTSSAANMMQGEVQQGIAPTYDSRYQLPSSIAQSHLVSPPMSPQHYGHQPTAHFTEGRNAIYSALRFDNSVCVPHGPQRQLAPQDQEGSHIAGHKGNTHGGDTSKSGNSQNKTK